MRFQLNVKSTAGQDIENMAVVFTAPTWNDAAEWAEKFLRQLGIKPADRQTEIVYAAKEENVIRASNLHGVAGVF